MFQNFLPKYSPKEIFQKNKKKDDANKRMQTSGCKPLRFHTRGVQMRTAQFAFEVYWPLDN